MPPSTRRALLLGVAALGAWWLVAVPRLSWLAPGETWSLTALYGLCWLPSLVFVAGHPCRIPLMPLWGLFYFIMFGSGFLNRVTQDELQFADPDAIRLALRLATLGAAVCLAMFYTPLGRWAERLVPKVRVSWDVRRAPRLGVLLVVTGLAANTLEHRVPLALAQIILLIKQLATIGTLTLFLLQLRRQLTWPLRLFLWGVAVPIQVLIGLGSGLLYQVIWALTPLLLCYAAERRVLPWKAVLLLAICLVPFSGSAKQEYRRTAWRGEVGEVEVTSSPIQRGLAFIELALRGSFESGSTGYQEAAAESAQSRASQLGTLVAVIELTPTLVPFWDGETYADFFWSFAPRFLFPNKPERILGHVFGQRYGFLDPWDEETSYNVAYQVVEMYINFGTLGVLLGMALVGLLYRALAAYVAHPNTGERELLIGCVLFTNLLSLESSFSSVFGGAVWFLVVMSVVLRVLARLDTAEAAAGAEAG